LLEIGDLAFGVRVEDGQLTFLGDVTIKMPGRGHFPMCEDPVGFAEHLFPVLDLLHGKYQS
jgi:pimeloyl-ACP methyl ester carboxylesterase